LIPAWHRTSDRCAVDTVVLLEYMAGSAIMTHPRVTPAAAELPGKQRGRMKRFPKWLRLSRETLRLRDPARRIGLTMGMFAV
jgi:hypothetical protein